MQKPQKEAGTGGEPSFVRRNRIGPTDGQSSCDQAKLRLEDAQRAHAAWKKAFDRRVLGVKGIESEVQAEEQGISDLAQAQKATSGQLKKDLTQRLKGISDLTVRLSQLNAEEVRLTSELQDLKSRVADVRPCADLLVSMTQLGMGFDTPDAVVNRARALRESLIEAAGELSTLLAKLEEGRAERATAQEDAETKLILAREKVRASHVSAHGQERDNEQILMEIRKNLERANVKQFQLVRTQSSITELYRLAVARTKWKDQDERACMGCLDMLEHVKMKINDLRHLLRTATDAGPAPIGSIREVMERRMSMAESVAGPPLQIEDGSESV